MMMMNLIRMFDQEIYSQKRESNKKRRMGNFYMYF